VTSDHLVVCRSCPGSERAQEGDQILLLGVGELLRGCARFDSLTAGS